MAVIKPFELGWGREIVLRQAENSNGPATSARSDVYYFSPEGTKLRSMRQVEEYLAKHETDLTVDCFSFVRKPLYREPFEIMRYAGIKRLHIDSEVESSDTVTTKRQKAKPTELSTVDENWATLTVLGDENKELGDNLSSDSAGNELNDSTVDKSAVNLTDLNSSDDQEVAKKPIKMRFVRRSSSNVKESVLETDELNVVITPSSSQAAAPAIVKRRRGRPSKQRAVQQPPAAPLSPDAVAMTMDSLTASVASECTESNIASDNSHCLEKSDDFPSNDPSQSCLPTSEVLQTASTLSAEPNSNHLVDSDKLCQLDGDVTLSNEAVCDPAATADVIVADSQHLGNDNVTISSMIDKAAAASSKETTLPSVTIVTASSSVATPSTVIQPPITATTSIEDEALMTVTQASANVVPACTNVTPASVNVTQASVNVTQASVNVIQASANVMPASANVTPASANVTQASANGTPVVANVTQVSVNVMPALTNVPSASANVMLNTCSTLSPDLHGIALRLRSSLSRFIMGNTIEELTQTAVLPVISNTYRTATVTNTLPTPAVSSITGGISLNSTTTLSSSIVSLPNTAPRMPASAETEISEQSINTQILTLPYSVVPSLDLGKDLKLNIGGTIVTVAPNRVHCTDKGLRIVLPLGSITDEALSSLSLHTNTAATCHFKKLYSNPALFLRLFSYLPLPDLLRVRHVCKVWYKFTGQLELWARVQLRDVRVTNWPAAALCLHRHGTVSLNVNGLVQDEVDLDFDREWRGFTGVLGDLNLVRHLQLGACHASVIHQVADKMPQLETLVAEEIVNSACTDEVIHLNFSRISYLRNLTCLRLHAEAGLTFTPGIHGNGLSSLSHLSQLQTLSLKGLTDIAAEQFSFLSALTQLQSLDLSSVHTWNAETFRQVGHLSYLRTLRLEVAQVNQPMGDECLAGLADCLRQLTGLNSLSLLNVTLTPAVIQSLVHMHSLKLLSLVIRADKATVTAMVEALMEMRDLQQLVWGIETVASDEDNLDVDSDIDLSQVQQQLSQSLADTQCYLFHVPRRCI